MAAISEENRSVQDDSRTTAAADSWKAPPSTAQEARNLNEEEREEKEFILGPDRNELVGSWQLVETYIGTR